MDWRLVYWHIVSYLHTEIFEGGNGAISVNECKCMEIFIIYLL